MISKNILVTVTCFFQLANLWLLDCILFHWLSSWKGWGICYIKEVSSTCALWLNLLVFYDFGSSFWFSFPFIFFINFSCLKVASFVYFFFVCEMHLFWYLSMCLFCWIKSIDRYLPHAMYPEVCVYLIWYLWTSFSYII